MGGKMRWGVGTLSMTHVHNYRDMNFKRKGYWPLNGNTKSLEQRGVKVKPRLPWRVHCPVRSFAC